MRKRQYLITDDIMEHMSRYEASGNPDVIGHLVLRVAEWYRTWAPGGDPARLGHTITSTYNVNFRTHVFSVLPPTFAGGFKKMIKATLVQMTDPSSQDTPPSVDDPNLWPSFELLGLVDRYESLIASVCYEHIESHVNESCEGKWDEPMLGKLREWMADKVVPWMLQPYARGAKNAEEARTMLQGVGSRFDFHVCKSLCDLRTKEIFDIIIDYPDSASALQDLKECLQRVDQRSQLVQTLRKANRKRLLHPGADTRDIITQYVSIIRCLRIIDPPGVLLFKVADPIRRYLRERPDTIRCIVASLVGDDESGDSLVDDTEPIQPLQSIQVEDYTDPNWEPEPIDAGPDFRTNKPSDVISTLVSIYDSKDLFVKELQVLLAQRLLAISDGNYEKERRNVEILKIRFGEAALQVCEVMLKDMTDSRRIDQHVQSQKSSIMHPTIISRHFWPPLQSSTFNMPGQFKEIQESYAREYAIFKPDKRLRWLPNLGTVHLEVELQDRTITADVSPLEAAFIELFSEKDVWTVKDLIERVGSIERSSAMRALISWVDRGVLKADGEDQFRLLEQADADHSNRPRRVIMMEEEPTVLSVQQQQADQMKAFWGFVQGMLRNLGALPLDRIQSMLRFTPGYDRNIEQLAGFMEAARREGLVIVNQGLWRLNR
ncbi:hypothetical protein EWM64_g8243 [Hericium alpestre]|uniref:Anaphase-promoting complex subunit 2 n=1 Tax=Hericium alpestre TaxID=135208 RepID=A0A4Y9ZQN0_9AGAM|nr:hypothetical protein EWM64_g8243 [Hericium alpestre]